MHPEPGRPPNGSVRIENLTRVVLRPYASPLPLGFLVLGIGSCLLSALQLGWVPVTDTHQVALAVLVFVAPLEFVAGIVAFLIRDVVMATGFGLLAGSWAAVGLLLDHGEPGTTSPVVGILAIAVGSAMLVPAATAPYGLEDAHHHAILPVSRRGTSRYAMSGDLGHQLDSLPTEVGVRQES